MHAEERARVIFEAVSERGFVTYRALQAAIAASPATIRRDLRRLQVEGRIDRVHGGAKLAANAMTGRATNGASPGATEALGDAAPLHRIIEHRRMIGRAAAALCKPGEAVMIGGDATTLQMCCHLDGLRLQVLTNSLQVVSALLLQRSTRVFVPSGAVFGEQRIILALPGEGNMPRVHAPTLFVGAAAIASQGIIAPDHILAAADRQLRERAETIILCADSTKFAEPSGFVLCALEDIDILITDDQIDDRSAQMVERAGVRLIVATRDDGRGL